MLCCMNAVAAHKASGLSATTHHNMLDQTPLLLMLGVQQLLLHSTGHSYADSLMLVPRSARKAFQAARIQYDRNVQKHEEQQVSGLVVRLGAPPTAAGCGRRSCEASCSASPARQQSSCVRRLDLCCSLASTLTHCMTACITRHACMHQPSS